VAEIHINVGVAALSRGFITLDAFAKAMLALSESHGQSVRDLWAAYMTPDQLASVIEAVKVPTQETTVFVAEPPPKPSAPPRGSEDLTTKVGKQPSAPRKGLTFSAAPTVMTFLAVAGAKTRRSANPPRSLEAPISKSRILVAAKTIINS